MLYNERSHQIKSSLHNCSIYIGNKFYQVMQANFHIKGCDSNIEVKFEKFKSLQM